MGLYTYFHCYLLFLLSLLFIIIVSLSPASCLIFLPNNYVLHVLLIRLLLPPLLLLLLPLCQVLVEN